ncbi:uncharacterized protein BXIN_0021 [Babesia sp. Xinjiang]|uniref:uncharacterized protein n=1 Tax=Babesia sp. Xinjiang TaxID=462227 RepID=UPI000A243C0E|nr:uncharacterized protein BXIN_0021 [Babesia sp. Xinjiang]ORM39753.1 hypothetical protein BXIN_0021 [Babesia sp. Xinjiang]
MGVLSSIAYVFVAPFRALRYKTATPQMRARIIKLGVICRKSWIFFPPLMMYQYIREKDKEMYTSELFYKNSNVENPNSFYDPSKPEGNRHWKIQHDLSLISAAANNRFN